MDGLTDRSEPGISLLPILRQSQFNRPTLGSHPISLIYLLDWVFTKLQHKASLNLNHALLTNGENPSSKFIAILFRCNNPFLE
jgi:hypothetical protein